MIKSLVEITDDAINLNMHKGQIQAWESDKRFVFVLAGTQGGKTSWGPWWLYREIARSGAGDYLAVTATYDLFKLKMLPELRHTFEDITKIGKYWAGYKVIELKNPKTGAFQAKKADDDMWGRIILRSADAEGGLEAATAKAAWLDECGQDSFKITAWEAVLRRLSLSEGRVLGTTTLYNLGWMKMEIYDRWERDDSNMDIIQFDSIMNPMFPLSEWERAKGTLPLWKFNMMYRGRYDRPAGMIYCDFDHITHIVEPFEIPHRWPVFVGIDPGGGVHTAVVWLAHDIDYDIYYLFHEMMIGGVSTPQYADRVKAFAGKQRVTYVGGTTSEKQFRYDWRSEGIRVLEPTVSDVESGIDRIIRLLKEHRLKIFNSCKGIIDEFGMYARKLDEFGEPTAKIKDKEKYHYLDALRYVGTYITKEHLTSPLPDLFSSDPQRRTTFRR